MVGPIITLHVSYYLYIISYHIPLSSTDENILLRWQFKHNFYKSPKNQTCFDFLTEKL